LICTIQTVQSSWSNTPIQGVRELERQSFRVIRTSELPVGKQVELIVEPRTVIDSRLTSLAENFQSSGLSERVAPNESLLSYKWSFEAPLGFVAKQNRGTTPQAVDKSTLFVEGVLKIDSQLQFELRNLSALRQEQSSDLINSLNELATGMCAPPS
jgi:hypothetical protein